MNRIIIVNNESKTTIKEQDVKNLIEGFGNYQLKQKDFWFTLHFVKAKNIQKINKEYRNKNQVTDVISFNTTDIENEILAKHNQKKISVSGEIFICVKKAKENSLKIGQSLQEELNFLMMHGFLHIIGYNHLESKEEKIMIKTQRKLRKKMKMQGKWVS